MKYWTIPILLFLSVNVFATKPCNPTPCYTDATSSKFDKKKCTNASSWIAIGKIDIKSHDLIGMPLNKDFISFDFISNHWEKAIHLKKTKIPFQVGWCINRIFPYENSEGLFRFYGTIYTTNQSEKEYRYLYIEKL